MSTITIGVLDDHYIVLQGLQLLSDLNPRISIVVSETTENKFYKRLMIKKPDIAIIDLLINNSDSIGLIKNITSELPETRIIIYTGNSPEHLRRKALLSGASFCLDKDLPTHHILEAITALVDNSPWPKFCLTAERLTRDASLLTDRETELLVLFAKGFTYKQIAYNLNISYHTVDSHKRKIYEKLQANNNTDLVNFAIAKNLIN